MWAGGGGAGFGVIRCADASRQRTLLLLGHALSEDGRRERGDDDRAERRIAKVGDGPIVVMVVGRRRGRGHRRRGARPFAIQRPVTTTSFAPARDARAAPANAAAPQSATS